MVGSQMMKMREILEKIVELTAPCEGVTSIELQVQAEALTALSEPPRNCDVGTAEEQAERFNHQCFRHHTGRCSPHCSTLPAKTISECVLKWSQMPYEAEEGGEA